MVESISELQKKVRKMQLLLNSRLLLKLFNGWWITGYYYCYMQERSLQEENKALQKEVSCRILDLCMFCEFFILQYINHGMLIHFKKIRRLGSCLFHYLNRTEKERLERLAPSGVRPLASNLGLRFGLTWAWHFTGIFLGSLALGALHVHRQGLV
jgi:hypothetical protein